MTTPRVDVGIITWNTRELTLQALERLRSTAEDVELRVLLRDNGSTDGTAQAVRSRYPEVEVEQGGNLGFAAGLNSLLRQSDAPWFLALNSDAWPEAGAVRRLVEAAVAHPRAAAVAPQLLRTDGSVEIGAHPLPTLGLAARGAFGIPRRGRQGAGPVGWAVGAALLLRRSALLEIGPWDERFFMYAEDLEWCWRAHLKGWQVWQEPAAVVRHVGNASGVQRFGEDRERVSIRNANLVVRDHFGVAALLWQVLNALGSLRLAAWWWARRRPDLARFWWRQVPAHLGLAREH